MRHHTDEVRAGAVSSNEEGGPRPAFPVKTDAVSNAAFRLAAGAADASHPVDAFRTFVLLPPQNTLRLSGADHVAPLHIHGLAYCG